MTAISVCKLSKYKQLKMTKIRLSTNFFNNPRTFEKN